jgi:hypothetical protein
MSISMYNCDNPDHVSKLLDIVAFSKAGAASTDTGLDIANMEHVFRSLFERIHELASEVIDATECMTGGGV